MIKAGPGAAAVWWLCDTERDYGIAANICAWDDTYFLDLEKSQPMPAKTYVGGLERAYV